MKEGNCQQPYILYEKEFIKSSNNRYCLKYGSAFLSDIQLKVCFHVEQSTLTINFLKPTYALFMIFYAL